jgi:tight adherence protein C
MPFPQVTGIPQILVSPALDISARLPRQYLNALAKTLIRSGNRSPSSLPQLLAFKIYLPLLLCFAACYFDQSRFVILCLPGFFLPDCLIYLAMKRRQQQIFNQLPDLLDLMVLCVDAGLGLDATLQRVARKQEIWTVLHEEIEQLNSDIAFGMPREMAYRDLYERTGLDELRELSSALNQCSKSGLSIAQTIRVQSKFMRSASARRAERQANKLPVWMAIPMCLLILPAIIMMLAGPGVLIGKDLFSQMRSQK